MASDLDIKSTIKLNNDCHIPQLGLGVWQIPNGQETENAVSWALEAGYRHIDTAKFYRNEPSVGNAIKNSKISRKDVWVTTKLWPLDFLKPRKAIEESLERLGFDYVDLYLIHWPVPGVSDKLWKNMESFVQEGLTRSIGVSNYSSSQLEKLLTSANVVPAINQVKCSPYNYPEELHDFCTKHGIVLEAYSPLTRGKNLDDKLLVEIAKKHGKSAAQVLLRWAIQQGLVVIPKSQNKDRINENSLIYDFNLDSSDMSVLSKLSN